MSAQPIVSANGLPFCAREACEEYDGKRCRMLGHQPTYICEPAVIEMAALIRRLQNAEQDREVAMRVKMEDRAMQGLLDDGKVT